MIYKSLIALMFFVASNAYAQQTAADTVHYTSPGGSTGTISYKPPTSPTAVTQTVISTDKVVNAVGACPQNTVRIIVNRSKASAGADAAGSYVQCQSVAQASPCLAGRLDPKGEMPSYCAGGSPLFQSQ